MKYTPITISKGRIGRGDHVVCPTCNYDWHYRGWLVYGSCPNCRHNVKIEENKIESPESVKVGAEGRLQRLHRNRLGGDPGHDK